MIRMIYLHAIILLSSFFMKAQEFSNDAFLSRWENTEHYVMEMLESVPDSLLDYKPVDSVFTIREQFTHIYNHLNYIHTNFLSPGTELKDWNLPDCEKKCLEEKLYNTFQAIKNTVDDSTEFSKSYYFNPADRELSGAEMLYLLLDHTKHHTGQLVVYLRLNGIKPPRYTGW